jgi:HTH-like domain
MFLVPAFTPGCIGGRALGRELTRTLTAKVRASLVGSARTYGARRVWRDVLAEGVSCGLHKIERLMRANALPGAASASWPAEGRRRPDIHRGAQCPRPAICSRAA